MKRITTWVVLAAIGLLLAGAILTMVPGRSEVVIEAVPTGVIYTTTLFLNWGAGHRVVTPTEPITIVDAFITLELRDENGDVVSRQRKAVPDWEVVYAEADVPASGLGSSDLTFTSTLSHTGYLEEWMLGEYIGKNGVVYTYTVPAIPSMGVDSDGFHLIGVLGDCPSDPSCDFPLQPTYTPEPTYTPGPTYTPEPTCPPTLICESPTPYQTATRYPTSTPYPVP